MASVVARNTSTQPTDVTTHTVNLPAGIQSGHLIIVLIAFDSQSTSITFTGYTSFATHAGAGALALHYYYRVANGSEGSTTTFTTGTGDQSSHISYLFTNYQNPATRAPSAANNAEAINANPDPPVCAPTAGSKQYIWLAVCGADAAVVTAAPTNYVNLQAAGTASDVTIGSAERDLTASSENPGTFTIASSIDNRASTIAIEDGVEGPSGAPSGVVDPMGMTGFFGG